MTIQQVEAKLGPPVDVLSPMPGVPNAESRQYKGDGKNVIIIFFMNGVAERVDSFVPRNNWFPVG